ncbi:MAG: 50S ribosome-binding GTPase, partial [Clostridia bacterium]|nr:50S ribosome-binding GTPase [Clostridia bacterium]
AVLHYGDELEKEDIDDGIPNDVYTALDTMIAELRAEKDKYASGRMIKDGFRVALIGLPNVGKSTLLNALTDSDRAIVTAEAGTTRDTLDGEYIYRNRKFIVTDTAGLNEKAVSEAEKIGIERAR